MCGPQKSFQILDLEIDDEAYRSCTSGICYHPTSELHLLTYQQIPDFLKGNPHIVHGYRPLLTFSMCIRSALAWTNETINIWSHMVGFYIFLLLTLYDNLISIPEMKGTLLDHIILTIGLACFMFCMLCSTGFHMFCCHSERASQRWLAVDMLGVSIGIIGCYVPSVYYAFYCFSIWRNIYLLGITCLCICALVFQLHPHFLWNDWFSIRIAIYLTLAAYGVVPTIHWVYIHGGILSSVVQVFVPKVLALYLIGGSAFMLYLTQLPERICPGKFDYLGASHQLWHILIVLAFYHWRCAGLDILLYTITTSC